MECVAWMQSPGRHSKAIINRFKTISQSQKQTEALPTFRDDFVTIVIILDLMLPGINGLEICSKLRAGSFFVPILMLTAKSSEVDRVVGLETGADDYLIKPFSIHELLARVKAIFRRVELLSAAHANQQSGDQPIICGGLKIDIEKREVTIFGVRVELTAKEFDLLAQFAAHPGKVYSRKQLLDLVWGYQHDGYEHTVNSHINRLRRKIEPDPGKPEFLLTVWGVGYKFNDAVVSQS